MRAAFDGSSSQVPSRPAGPNCRIRSPTSSSLRKFSCTKVPRLAPIWSLRVGMIAVWGIGRRRGWRNRAVTANQSATPPTMAASAAAST